MLLMPMLVLMLLRPTARLHVAPPAWTTRAP
jgi:hypothetical protein